MNARQRSKRRRQRWIGKRAAKLTLFGMFVEATKGMKPLPYRDRSAETLRLLRGALDRARWVEATLEADTFQAAEFSDLPLNTRRIPRDPNPLIPVAQAALRKAAESWPVLKEYTAPPVADPDEEC